MALPPVVSSPASLRIADRDGRHRAALYMPAVSTLVLGFVEPDHFARPLLIVWSFDTVDPAPRVPYRRTLRICAEPLGGRLRERDTATVPSAFGALPLLVERDLAPTVQSRRLRRYWVGVDDDELIPVDCYGVRLGWAGEDGVPATGIPLIDDGPNSFRDDDWVVIDVTAVAGTTAGDEPYWWTASAMVE